MQVGGRLPPQSLQCLQLWLKISRSALMKVQRLHTLGEMIQSVGHQLCTWLQTNASLLPSEHTQQRAGPLNICHTATYKDYRTNITDKYEPIYCINKLGVTLGE